MEATLVLIKPDAIARGLTGAVITHLETLPLKLIGAKVATVSQALAEEHYQALKAKPFFKELIKHIRGQLNDVESILALVYAGEGAIERVRQLAGATNPEDAEPTSLRGAFGRMTRTGVMENVIHSSSDAADAEREIRLWFRPDELLAPPFPTKTAPGQVKVWA
jgi:nucleoside-diphosphate kinase